MRPSFFFFFFAITVLSNPRAKTKIPPKKFFASHIWPRRVRHSESIWISLTAGDQSGRERRDGRRKQQKKRTLKGERHERNTTGWKNRKQNKWISRVPRSPRNMRAADLSGDYAGADCEKVKVNQKNKRFFLHYTYFLDGNHKLLAQKINRSALKVLLTIFKNVSLNSSFAIAPSSPELITFRHPPPPPPSFL